MARDPKIAYVLLRNAHFGPRLAASVELCVRDLVLHSRHGRSTLVVCPPVDQPFEGVEIATISRAPIVGNLGKAWSVARLLRRREVDLAIVENHVPAAAFIALASRVPVILHTHAYVKAPSGALPAAFRRQELRPLSGFAFVSDYALNHFRGNFPHVSPPMRAVPNGLDMANWRCPTSKEKMILSVGRALKGKGHIEAMGAIARVLSSRPDWKARFILADAAAADLEPQTVQALRDAAAVFGRRVRIDSNVPYADVKAAWESAAIGMVLTRGPEPFGRTALEALASGAALITSGLGGLAEVCGPCAVRVDPGDADALAAALGALIDAPDRRADLARAGRKRVEALFDIRTAAGRMDDFIDACIGERRAGTKAPVAFHSRNG